MLAGWLIAFLFLFVSYNLFQTETVQFATNKVFTSESIGGSRMNSYKTFFETLQGVERVIGIGIGNEEYYFARGFGTHFGYSNTIGYLIIGTGFVGLSVFLLYLFYLLYWYKQ